MNLRTVLLGFLAREEMTGYELKRLMERSVGFFFGASYGSIYPALKDLEGEGLVRSTAVVQDGRPNKKVYEITSEGRARLRGALEEPPAGDAFRSEFLMHLFFGHLHEPERLLKIIRKRRDGHRAAIETLKSVEEEYRGDATLYQMMTLRSGLVSARAQVAFLDEIEAEILALALDGEAPDGREAGMRS